MKGGRSASSLWVGAGLGLAVVVIVAVLASSRPAPSAVAGAEDRGRDAGGPVLLGPTMATGSQRSTGPAVGGRPMTATDGSALRVPVATAAETTGPPVSCPWSGTDRDRRGTDRDERVVALAYCALLRRAPDAEGTAYWSGQLGAGLSVRGLVLQIAGSAEYRRAEPGRDRWETSPFDALAALTEGRDRRPAAERATAPSTTGPDRPTADRGGLLERQPITTGQFDRWVADRGLGDVDRVTGALVHGRLSGGGQVVNVVYVHRSVTRDLRVSPAGRGRATVGSWAREIGADVAINGNWYAPWDGPAVSGGQVYGGSDHGYTALFGVTADGDVVLEHHRQVNGEVDPLVVEGVSGHPTLIHRGARTTDFGTDPTFLNRNPRTAIGLDASGDILILVTVDGRSSLARGMTGDETARLLERLGANDAVMLDGGGSTTMWIAGRGVVNRPSGALRAVGNQIAAFGS